MKLPRGEHELQCLGIFVHGALASLHALGCVYNLRKRNWFDAGMHTAAAIYDVWATSQHAAAAHRIALSELQEQESARVPILNSLLARRRLRQWAQGIHRLPTRKLLLAR